MSAIEEVRAFGFKLSDEWIQLVSNPSKIETNEPTNNAILPSTTTTTTATRNTNKNSPFQEEENPTKSSSSSLPLALTKPIKINFNNSQQLKTLLLNTDFRRQPSCVLPILPSDALTTPKTILLPPGPFVLQILSVHNIAVPSKKKYDDHPNTRLLHLTFTDGHNKIHGIELTPILGLKPNTPPGSKILWKGIGAEGEVFKGKLQCTTENCQFLGGEVVHLVESFTANLNAIKYREMQQGGTKGVKQLSRIQNPPKFELQLSKNSDNASHQKLSADPITAEAKDTVVAKTEEKSVKLVEKGKSEGKEGKVKAKDEKLSNNNQGKKGNDRTEKTVGKSEEVNTTKKNESATNIATNSTGAQSQSDSSQRNETLRNNHKAPRGKTIADPPSQPAAVEGKNPGPNQVNRTLNQQNDRQTDSANAPEPPPKQQSATIIAHPQPSPLNQNEGRQKNQKGYHDRNDHEKNLQQSTPPELNTNRRQQQNHRNNEFKERQNENRDSVPQSQTQQSTSEPIVPPQNSSLNRNAGEPRNQKGFDRSNDVRNALPPHPPVVSQQSITPELSNVDRRRQNSRDNETKDRRNENGEKVKHADPAGKIEAHSGIAIAQSHNASLKQQAAEGNSNRQKESKPHSEGVKQITPVVQQPTPTGGNPADEKPQNRTYNQRKERQSENRDEVIQTQKQESATNKTPSHPHNPSLNRVEANGNHQRENDNRTASEEKSVDRSQQNRTKTQVMWERGLVPNHAERSDGSFSNVSTDILPAPPVVNSSQDNSQDQSRKRNDKIQKQTASTLQPVLPAPPPAPAAEPASKISTNHQKKQNHQDEGKKGNNNANLKQEVDEKTAKSIPTKVDIPVLQQNKEQEQSSNQGRNSNRKQNTRNNKSGEVHPTEVALPLPLGNVQQEKQVTIAKEEAANSENQSRRDRNNNRSNRNQNKDLKGAFTATITSEEPQTDILSGKSENFAKSNDKEGSDIANEGKRSQRNRRDKKEPSNKDSAEVLNEVTSSVANLTIKESDNAPHTPPTSAAVESVVPRNTRLNTQLARNMISASLGLQKKEGTTGFISSPAPIATNSPTVTVEERPSLEKVKQHGDDDNGSGNMNHAEDSQNHRRDDGRRGGGGGRGGRWRNRGKGGRAEGKEKQDS